MDDAGLTDDSLPAPAKLILALLSRAPRSGYDIRRTAELRLFWPVGMAGIYAELKRLAQEGLIQGDHRPRGARPRTVYSLTPLGRTRLRQWLAEDPPLRRALFDEGLLKLLAVGALPREEALARVRQIRQSAIRARAARLNQATLQLDAWSTIVLQATLEVHEQLDQCYADLEDQLSDPSRLAPHERSGVMP